MQPNVFRANAPQLYVDVNRAQCMTMGVSLADAFDTLQTYLGSLYVNDFNLFGRTWQVVVQADAKFRNQIDAARQLKVRNSQGGMVPIGALADVREVNGPLVLTRFNMYPAAAVNGSPAPGVSSRQAIDMMQQLADRELLPAMRCEWTEMAYLELQAGNTAMMIFGLAVVMVFLVLAAQYESWSLPLAVILVVPMCLLSAVTGVTAVPACLQGISAAVKPLSAALAYTIGGAGMPMDINIFTQIGFVVLVGLASKNAILIVEFAKRQREGGMPRHEAALAACKLRLRPIVMTSFAFILGVSPLLIAHGAGAEMRRTLGTAVFSGMLGVTLFGIFLTPVFFTVIDWLGGMNLFHSRLARWIRFLTLGFFALGFLWMLFRFSGDLVRHAWRKVATTPNRPTTWTNRIEDAPCFHASSSIDRSSPRCCRSSSRWPAASPCGCCRSPSIRRSRRRRWKSRLPIPAPTPRWWPTRWPRRSSSRSTAWKACSTCRRSAPTTASTR